ncbi:MAG: DUF4230 domain-containing protein [Eubacterium sp.]|nr:DUF4230 domain-containing protein [Eubacterium sp.]
MLNNEINKKFKKGVKLFKNICTAIVVVFVIGAISIGGYKLKNHWNKSEEPEASNVFAEEVDVTVYDVKEQLKPIGELATYGFDYEGKEKIEDSIEAFDKWDVPLTKHTIDVEYEGKIKVGYEMKDIDLSVDNKNQVINVVLPEPQVLDNYIDTYSTVDKNNVLNPIESDEAQDYLDNIVEPKELAAAEEQGIYEKAEENAQDLIKDQLSYFEKHGYTVEFPESVPTK